MNLKFRDAFVSSGALAEALKTPQGIALCIMLSAVASLVRLSRSQKQRGRAFTLMTVVMFVGMTGSLISWYAQVRSERDIEYVQYLWRTEQGRWEFGRQMKRLTENQFAAGSSVPAARLQDASGNEFIDDIFDGGVEIINSKENKFQGSAFINGPNLTATSHSSRHSPRPHPNPSK